MTVFKEEQKFNQWWLWLIIIGVGLIPVFGLYFQIIENKPFGNNPMSNTGLIINAILCFGLALLFWLMKLKTEIDNQKISIHLFPFMKKKIAWEDIETSEVINYGFVGGWGIRLWTKYGTVYNTSGKIGLALKLKNGKKLLIGTQKEKELKAFLENRK